MRTEGCEIVSSLAPVVVVVVVVVFGWWCWSLGGGGGGDGGVWVVVEVLVGRLDGLVSVASTTGSAARTIEARRDDLCALAEIAASA